MTSPDQKKTNWLLIWILSIVSAPLSLYLINFGDLWLVVPVALIFINIIASLKLSESEKRDRPSSPSVLKIFMFLWIMILGMGLMAALIFGGCLLVWAPKLR